ncbi:MAG: hypothetical protein ACFCVC_06245 [Acidimicrobiia bacterium]
MLEQKIRSELDRTTAPTAGGGGDVDSVMRRGRFLRRRLMLARGGAAVLMVVAAVGVGSLLDQAVPDQPRPVADGVAEPGSINVLPGLDIPIDGEMGSFGRFTVYRGRMGPAPDFEPEGTEQPLEIREEIHPPVELIEADLVYAGTVNGVEGFLQPSRSGYTGLSGLIDRVFDGPGEPGVGFIAWHPASESINVGYLLGATRPTGSIGGVATGLMPVEPGARPDSGPSFLAWPATPEDTAVVGLLRDGEQVRWQRPVAGAAVFVLGEGVSTEGLEMVAFAVDGSVLGTAD